MSHDDFAFEPVKGLPESPPQGEELLWQGRPDAWALTCDALNLGWVAGYFCLLAVWRFVAVVDLMPLQQAIGSSLPFLVLGAIVCVILFVLGWVQARATVYTITNRRVAMRMGAALTVTLNLPYTQIESVDLATGRNGIGSIVLKPVGALPLGFAVCWPHVRPWHFNKPEPTLRCIRDAEKIAHILADAAEARLATPSVTRKPQVSAAMAAE